MESREMQTVISCLKIGSLGKVTGGPVINMSWSLRRKSKRQTLVIYLDYGHVSVELVSHTNDIILYSEVM